MLKKVSIECLATVNVAADVRIAYAPICHLPPSQAPNRDHAAPASEGLFQLHRPRSTSPGANTLIKKMLFIA